MHDNGADIDLAVRLTDLAENLICAAHNLQLCVNNAFMCVGHIQDTVKKKSNC